MNRITGETDEILLRIGLLDKKEEISGELAHGHKRALQLGLVLAMDPEVILLDEPTAGMPSEETMQMVELIEKNTAHKALIIVEHDMDVVFSIADRITVSTTEPSSPPAHRRISETPEGERCLSGREEDDAC